MTESRNFNPTSLDLILSAAIALLFPLLAGFLFEKTGALLPMVLYYGTAWGLSLWRRGKTGYSLKNIKAPPFSFYINVAVIILTLVIAYLAREEFHGTPLMGIVATALIWTVANASSEQLLWIYIFESWDLHRRDASKKIQRYAKRAIGLVFFSLFVGTIHGFYWARFLHTVDSAGVLGTLFIAATSLSGYLHIIVWRQGKNMLYTFIPHLMLNLFPLLWTGYSILPYLIR